jgi:SUKH-4 immunity protein
MPDLDSYSNFWPPDTRIRWSADLVAATSLTAASKSFLVDVGMPIVSHVSGAGFSDLAHMHWDLSLTPIGTRRILATSHSGEASILIDDEGTVLESARPPHRNGLPGSPERIMNSNIERLALCLTEQHRKARAISPYQDTHAGSRNLDEEIQKERENLAIFESRLRAIDADAIAQGDSHWAYQLLEIASWLD